MIDGLARDLRQVEEMKFPVFATGARPISSKGRLIAIDYGCRIRCGGVYVESGDLVYGDVDGVVVVPGSVVEEAIRRGMERVSGERVTKKELMAGSLLKQVYDKYGTL